MRTYCLLLLVLLILSSKIGAEEKKIDYQAIAKESVEKTNEKLGVNEFIEETNKLIEEIN